jgi:hypothetical protein
LYCEGLVDTERISWRYLQPIPYEGAEGFSGSEEYVMQSENDYLLRAEYCSGDHRTFIIGHIWKK